MSRSQMIKVGSERISLGLCPGRIGVVRRKMGWKNRKQLPECGVINVPQVTTTEGWKPGLDIVERWLEKYEITNVTAALTLSNRFARFALVPWSSQVNQSEEETALTQARFENQYGDMTGWTVRLDSGRYGEVRIACAMETKLLDSLRSLFAARRIACHAVQPYFVASWNRWHRQFDQTDGLFAIAESQMVVMASIKAGGWQSLRAVHSTEDEQSLHVLLEREALLQGFTGMPQTRIHAPSLRGADISAWPEKMRLLEPADFEAALAMALEGDEA